MQPDPVFLKVSEVLELHDEAIRRFGGSPGIRDLGLIESAVLAPQQTFGGSYLYQTLEEMGAAYLFGHVVNHGFLDGNKRVGLAACDTFLLMNGRTLTLADGGQVSEVVLAVATSECDFPTLVAIVKEAVKPSL
jgi:death-on-curing protein